MGIVVFSFTAGLECRLDKPNALNCNYYREKHNVSIN